ncbi:MAG TPA: helix-turn-helix domain-containing protein [Acidimicrobiales bacterium]|nr:helix-turn-helix domain-containing protein [Acidimicrobiales bacterium]
MTALQQQARALGDPTRHGVFRYLADADRPVGVAELTAHFRLNHNAIRQHLAKLVAAGLAVEATARPSGPGRPRLVYAVAPAAEGHWGTVGPYERLSRMLVEVIRTGLAPDEVGRRAAGEIGGAAPSGDAIADIATAMARQGFDPDVRRAPGGTEIVLRRCPFESAARADPATVCALHLGLAEGLATGTDVVVDELVAHEPHRAGCRLRLRAGGHAPEPGPGGPEPGPGGPQKLSLRGRARR